MLFEESGISPDVAAERGYYTASRRSEVPKVFEGYQRKPGLVVPTFSPDGETVGYQLRPDRPRKDRLKYETPDGVSPVVDVHPRMLEEVRHGDRPLLITEGAKTGDAATSRGVPAVVLAGVWMWCVPKARPYRLKPCFDHVRLAGREVVVAFDSDCMSKANVQDALAALVAALEARGAEVKVIYLPDAPDGSKQGVDDYLAAGGTVKEMLMLARELEPADLGRVRLSRDEKLRVGVNHLWREWRDRNWMRFVGAAEKGNWARGHTARDVMEALIGLATRIGKPDERGIVVQVGARKLADLAAKTATSVGKAVKHLEADGQIEILPAEDRIKARSYRLLVPRATLYSMEEGHDGGPGLGEGDPRCKPLRAPSASRLRWSSPARPGARLVRHYEPTTGRILTEAVGENVFIAADRGSYERRLGPHRCAVLDALEAAGGELRLGELCGVLHRKRPRDVRSRILKPLEDAGIIECEGDVIRLVADWLGKLEEERERRGEIAQAEEQRANHRKQGDKYREHLARERRGTPEASLAAVRRTRELRERRLREIREEKKRDRAPTPLAVEALLTKVLAQNGRMRLGLLCEIANDEGLRRRDVPPAVRRLGYRTERLPEYGNEEFVYGREKDAA